LLDRGNRLCGHGIFCDYEDALLEIEQGIVPIHPDWHAHSRILDKHLALIIPYTANAIPLNVIILSAFMRSIPIELEEAAVMDGLSAKGVFAKIIFPLTIPALVTVFILNFIGNWNEFLLANFFISTDELRTLPVGMVGFRDTYNTNYAQMSAGIVYSVVPVMIIYAVLQKQIIEGLTAGGVKG
jgi:raffinose/stachyose/melibiose transport system permease protein